MNAEQCLELYERIADAPDAVARLRQLILGLAVGGKLVRPDPNDEPAMNLVRRIAAEKVRLEESGEFREPSNVLAIERKDLPFAPPDDWGWVRLIDVARASYGFAFPSAQFNATKKGMPLIRIRDISGIDAEVYFDGEYDPFYVVNRGDYLVGMDGDFNLRRWRGRQGLLNQRVLRLDDWRCGICSEFVRLPLQFVLRHLHERTSLTTVKHLSAKQVNGIEIPLPPLAEQHRIVTKVEELMALCDQLETARKEREATRDRFTAATLGRLDVPSGDSETFQRDVRFALANLPTIACRTELIPRLRKAIVNLAAVGKLVPQVSAFEINSNGSAKLHEGQLQKTRRHVPDNVEMPPAVKSWGIPNSWECLSTADMLRLGLLVDLKDGNHGANHPKVSEFSASGLPFITAAQVQRHTIDFDGAYRLSGAPLERLRVGFARSGDVIYTHKGSVGRVAIAPSECVLSPQTTYYRPNPTRLFARYIMWFMESGLFCDQVDEVKKQTTRDFVAISKQYEFFHAIPPFEEQRRIADRVDRLMEVCDQLEESLSVSGRLRTGLLDFLLANAFNATKVPIEQGESDFSYG